MCPEKGNVSGFNYNLKGNVSGIGKINVSEMCPEFSDFGFFSLRMGCSEMDYRHNQCSRWFYWTAVSFADIYGLSHLPLLSARPFACTSPQPFGFLDRLVCGPLFCKVACGMADRRVCRLCGLEHASAAGRMHGRSFTCTGCWSAKAMLQRNLGDRTELKDFSPAETHSFFRAIAKEKEKQGGRIQWVTVRATLVRSLTDRRISTFRATCAQKELPLSVWVNQGWDKTLVEACPNRFSDELGTQVYAVPVRELSWGEEYAKIEEQVLRHEREGQKSKGGKKKKDNAANAEASSDGELDLPAAEGSVSDKKGKPEVDRKKLLAKNVALADKAAKALGPLQGTATGVAKLLEKVEKSGCEIPEGIKQSKDDCMGKLETWATAARECINVHESTRELWKDAGGDLLPLTALPFEGNDVKLLLKQATEVQSALRSLLPKKEAKAKAAPKANAAAKASPKKRAARSHDSEGGDKRRKTGKSPP